MAKHRGQSEPDDAALGALLRAEGERYAPDAVRIRSRIDAGLAAGAERAVPPRLRLLPPLAVAGAVAATLVGVVVLVERAPERTPPALTTSAAAVSTSAPTSSAPSTSGRPVQSPAVPSPSHDSGAPRSSEHPSPTVSVTRPTTSAAPTSASSQAPTGSRTRAVATTVAALPGRLGLPVAGGEVRDWVVVGARNDGKLVRQKNGAGLIAAPEVVAGSAEPASAPVNVTWSGGIPEQDRTDNGKWWTAPSAPTVFRVRLGALDRPSKVTLYLGATGTTVQVRASVDGLSGTGTSASVSPGAKAAVTIQLDQPAVGHTVTIEVGAGDSSTEGTISLAAVVLR